MADGNISTTTAATGISASTTIAANANDRRLIVQRVRRCDKVPGFIERHHNPACEIRPADHAGNQLQHIIRHGVAPQAKQRRGGVFQQGIFVQRRPLLGVARLVDRPYVIGKRAAIEHLDQLGQGRAGGNVRLHKAVISGSKGD